jgi:hypothetical protein
MVAPLRLSVVDVTAPPMEIPIFDPYVTRQLAELSVIPTLDTAPPNTKQLPDVITLLPVIEIVDDVKEMADDDIARNAPVAGAKRELVSAMIVASVTVPVADTMLRPYTVAVVSCMFCSVVTAPNANASVVAMQLTVVPTSVSARLVLVPTSAWFDVSDMLIVHPFIDTVIELVLPAQLTPVFTHAVDAVHACVALPVCDTPYTTK